MPKRPRGFKGVLWGRATSAMGVRVPCHWCRRPMDFTSATVDHEPALAEGGTSRGAVLACDACNQERSRETSKRLEAKRKHGKKRYR